VACSAFWTTRISAINTLLDRASFVFAGQVAPLALLPGLVHTLAYALPFGYMLGVPAAILSGQVPVGQAGRLLAAQAGWVGLTYVAFQLCWRLGLRQYSAVGT
jgi:ABC-2 type transport system permease protein